MKGRRRTMACPYCGNIMIPPRRCGLRPGRVPPSNMRTRDHIRPRAWGGADAADNRRYCCQRCNQLRAALGHCIGALACVIAVARDRRRPSRSIGYVARSWHLLRAPLSAWPEVRP